LVGGGGGGEEGVDLYAILQTDPLFLQLKDEIKEVPSRMDLISKEEVEAFYR
jgi:hypothetical protein